MVQQDERLWKFIRTLDRDGDDKISLDEIRTACQKTHHPTEYIAAFEEIMTEEEAIEVTSFGMMLLGDVIFNNRKSVVTIGE